MQKVKQRRFLIVNGYHDIWHYVPMGSFGICDYLETKGIRSRIFNAAIYKKNNYIGKLNEVIGKYRPTHIGLVLHWKELLENVIFLSDTIKKAHPQITLVAGGITAGYLQKGLLKKCPSIDYVIKGDAELPLLKLISGLNIQRIPNLAYRDNGNIVINSCSYHIRSKELDGISYSNLSYLFDYNKYLKIIDNMGFPMFIGRGCIYNCLYCGGSKRAFEIHSGRKKVVNRSVKAIVNDLRRLLKYTDNIYFDYETDIAHIRELFTRILSDKMLNGKFRINYGTWSLMDAEIIDLYSRICRFDPHEKPVIEISPESSVERIRRCVRDRALCFKNSEMLQNIDDILKATSDGVIINVFCSRYHHKHKGISHLLAELYGIHSFREYYFRKGSCNNVDIHSSHLATDVASVYWDLANKNRTCDDPMDLLIKTHRRFCSHSAGEYEMDNMCIYHPDSLGEGLIFCYEQLIKWLDMLHDLMPHYYFTITKSVGIERVIQILMDAADQYYRKKKWDKFNNATTRSLIGIIHEGIGRRMGRIYSTSRIYFNDLERLFVKYCDVLESNRKRQSAGMPKKPVLDKSRCCISEFDYLADDFYKDLEGGINNVERKKTINLISNGYIHKMDYKFYPVLGLYDGENTPVDVYRKMKLIGPQSGIGEEDLSSIENFLRRHDREFTV